MKQSSVGVVFDAIVDLHNNNQTVTREVLVEHTGIVRDVIDYCVKALIGDGRVVRLRRGVYVPSHTHAPSRPISKTVMPCGEVIIEVGEDLLRLTPHEARTLGRLMHGDSVAFSNIQAGIALAGMVDNVG